MKEENVVIDTSLVRRLISSQFPQWKKLSIDPVATSGGIMNFSFRQRYVSSLAKRPDYDCR